MATSSDRIQPSILRDTQLIQHFRLPKFPPQRFITALFIINLLICFVAHNHMVFRLICYIYGSLMIYRQHNDYFYLKATFAVNCVLFWFLIIDIHMTLHEERIVFCIFLIIYYKIIFKALIGTFRAIFLFTKRVEFDDIFWVVQIGLLVEYINYFSGLKILRFLPSLLRVVQSLRGNNRSSYMSALRYSVHFIKQIFPQYTAGWIIFSIFVSVWQVYNNYWNQFGVFRLRKQKGSVFMYPRQAIWYGFIAIGVAQWGWVIPGRHVGIFSMIRKFLWNFMRVQYRMAQMYKKYAILSIIDVDPKYAANLVI